MRFATISSLLLAVGLAAAGCHEPTVWPYTGPRVFLIKGTPEEESDGLYDVRDDLLRREINAAVYSPDDWLKVVNDIDRKPDEEAIVVGHGHGGFLATQVARHYAQEHKTKHIKHVIVVDGFNKDWPWAEHDSHKPTPAPIGHNSRRVHNFTQRNSASEKFGTTYVSTRNSNVAEEHPYYWYDNYWYDRPVTGQRLSMDRSQTGVVHETIDNEKALVERITTLARRSALSPYHYTPVRHHPYAQPSQGAWQSPSAAR